MSMGDPRVPWTGDGFTRELAKMRRDIGNLQRKKVDTPRIGGDGVDEAFRAATDSNTGYTGSGTLDFSWADDTESFHTDGVSGFDSYADTVTIPAGLWWIGLTGYWQVSGGVPTSGSATLGLNIGGFNQSLLVQGTFDEIDDTLTHDFSVAVVMHVTAETDIAVWYSETYAPAVTVRYTMHQGGFAGVRLSRPLAATHGT